MSHLQGNNISKCTRSRDRTGMGKAHWFLRPARLPIPPSGHEIIGVGVHCVCLSRVWGAKIIDLGVYCKLFPIDEMLFNIPKFASRP